MTLTNKIKCIIRYRHKPMNFQVDKKMKKSIVLNTCAFNQNLHDIVPIPIQNTDFLKKKNNLFTNKKKIGFYRRTKGHVLLKDVFRIPDVIYYVHTTSFITSTFYLV